MGVQWNRYHRKGVFLTFQQLQIGDECDSFHLFGSIFSIKYRKEMSSVLVVLLGKNVSTFHCHPFSFLNGLIFYSRFKSGDGSLWLPFPGSFSYNKNTMAETKTLTAKEILDKKFTKDVKGYDALEVDDFLDRVIKDYQTFQNEIARRDAAIAEEKKQMLALQAQNNTSALETAKQRIHELELENASYKNKLAGIASADPNLNVQNINYIKRIQALESFVWQLGYDPRTLKKRNS